MRHDILFTVISPLYAGNNRFVGEAYKSLLRQSYPWWEWVVCENNGGHLPDEIRSDPRVVCFEADPKLGRNISALKQASVDMGHGDVVVVLDADDLLTDDALELAHKAYVDHPWAEAVVGGEMFFIEPGCEHLHQRSLANLPDEWIWYKGRKMPVRYNPGIVRPGTMSFASHFLSIRRSIFDLVGGYNYSMSHADDVGLCIRLVQMGARVYSIRRPMYLNRWHKQAELHANIADIVVEAYALRSLAVRRWPTMGTAEGESQRPARWLEV